MPRQLPPPHPSDSLPATAGQAGAPAPAIPQGYVDAEWADVRPRHLRDHLLVLWKYRWLAATCFAAVFGGTCLVTLLAPRTFTASVRLHVSKQAPIKLQLEENVLQVDESDRNVNGASSFLATQVAALKSRDLAERVIRARHLDTDPAFLDPGTSRRGLMDVGRGMLGVVRPRGLGIETAQPSHEDEGPSTAPLDPALIDQYMDWLSVSDVRGTDIIEVAFHTPNPSLSAILAGAHAQAYLESGQEEQRETDVQAKEFLGKQLEEARRKVERSEDALRRFSAEHPNVAINQEQKTVAQRIQEVSTLLTKAEGQRLGLESRFGFLTRNDADPEAYFREKPGLQKLNLALIDIRAQRASLDGELGPKHPEILALAKQEAELARQVKGQVTEEVATVRAQYRAAKEKEAALRARYDQLQDEGIRLRDLGARYDLLKNDGDTARALHASLLKQQAETAVNAALVSSNVRVLERPEVPQRPSKPNVPLNLTLGLLGGLVCAVGAAFAVEYFDSSLKSSDEVEELTGLPTLSVVPNFALAHRTAYGPYTRRGAHEVQRRSDLVVANEPWSVVAESFRTLRAAVLFSTPERAPKVVLVTSASAGEGKTVSALNLATSLAETGASVLLVDVDLRHPSCHRSLSLSNAKGLSSYLTGRAELEDVAVELETPRLTFVPAGPTPPNPAELIGSKRMRDTMDRFREAFDFVILDSPPVMPVSDALVLSREADGVVLVVKGHDTPREIVRRARDQLVLANAYLLGTVVNNVGPAWGDRFMFNRYYRGYYHRRDAKPEQITDADVEEASA